MTGAGMTTFIAGFIAGAAVFWHVSLAVERFRRARRDFAATRQGLRTLVEMMVHRGVEAVRGVFVATLIVGAVFLWWRHRGFR